MKARPVTFTTFAEKVLRLRLTAGQRVMAKVAFDGVEPGDLRGDERTMAQSLFGDVDTVPPMARRILCLVLGRGSGKTTIAAAFGLYTMVTADVSACGPGDVPTVVVIAPRRQTAALSVRMALEMVRGTPELKRLLETENGEGFSLRRPDGRLVALAAFAASRGGASARGVSILSFLLDEAQFFQSDDDGAYAVNDRDVYRALIPRLMKGGKGVLISTPWPVETLMGELFEKNFGQPETALAAKAPTLLMRGDDPELPAIIEMERRRDLENALREFDCEMGEIVGASTLLDPAVIDARIDTSLVLPVPPVGVGDVFAGADFGFTSDSSALAVAGKREGKIALLALDELRPKRGAPLVVSEVVTRFADIVKPYGVSAITADQHYAESVREHLRARSMRLDAAPGGQPGKATTYLELRRTLNEGILRLPQHPRLIAQLKSVIATPTSGGGLKISSPRRTGGGHGDIVSAVVLAVWQAAQARPPRRIVAAFGSWSTDDVTVGRFAA